LKFIENVINISKVCDLAPNYDIVFVAYENEVKNTLKEELCKIKKIIPKQQQTKIGIVIGPEGGLELEEIGKMQEKGAKIVTLGKRILRTETVSLNVLSIIMYELED